ncbi:MAG: hypothetical protein II956_16870 [Bacteroidales bacterium]|nr:hypothetical protein [Bacteroidales bacterium]
MFCTHKNLIKQKAYDMARMMKTDGEPIEKIMRYSGLTADEILTLILS